MTYAPRNGTSNCPARDPSKDHISSLEQLLALPDVIRSSSEHIEPIINVFDNDRSFTEYCNAAGLQPRATAVAKAVHRSLDRPANIYANIWTTSSEIYGSSGTTASRLLEAETSIGNEGDVNGARYRVNAIMFAFHFRARCENSIATTTKEKLVLQKIVDESGKKIHQIKALLKRGRWYTLWVSKLGLGAILTLGETLA